MTSLLLLTACASMPWMVCRLGRALWAAEIPAPAAIRERALQRYRRATLFASLAVLPASAVGGALLVDPSLSTRWPAAGSYFFASLCVTTAWVSLALGQRTPEEAAAMKPLETAGRAVQMSSAPLLALGLSLVAHAGAEALLPVGPMAKALTVALLSVGAVVIVSPWMVIALGLWPSLPKRVVAEGTVWRLAHLPAPAPFLTHAAALPWLHTVLVSDGVFQRAPEDQWETLVRYEIASAPGSRAMRFIRWAVAMAFSVLVFTIAGTLGEGRPTGLVAATAVAVLLTTVASWLANRQAESSLSLDGRGPSMHELARSLRSLPPRLGQALPRTSHRPLSDALYDRLFALGHDPGRRPHG